MDGYAVIQAQSDSAQRYKSHFDGLATSRQSASNLAECKRSRPSRNYSSRNVGRFCCSGFFIFRRRHRYGVFLAPRPPTFHRIQ